MTGKIVVATDGSDTGHRAIDFAAALSEKFGMALCIVHVLMHGRPSKEFERMADVEGIIAPAMSGGAAGDVAGRATLSGPIPSADDELRIAKMINALGDHVAETAKRRALDAGAKNVTTRICAGDIADEILDVAEADAAEIIVLGRRGLGRVREALLGSVSQKVLHHADCKVIVVQ